MRDYGVARRRQHARQVGEKYSITMHCSRVSQLGERGFNCLQQCSTSWLAQTDLCMHRGVLAELTRKATPLKMSALRGTMSKREALVVMVEGCLCVVAS
jgi:hypothetical protein